MEKAELRSMMKLLRKNFTGKHEASEKITELVINSDFYKKSDRICLYMSSFGEVDTHRIFSHAVRQKKSVCVPITEKDGSLRLSLCDGNFKKGRFGIDEPEVPSYVDFSYPELILIPGLAFDRRGTRLGFGMGCYDRFLKDARGFKVALGYCFQLLDFVPDEAHDVRLDALVTEKGIIYFE